MRVFAVPLSIKRGHESAVEAVKSFSGSLENLENDKRGCDVMAIVNTIFND